MKKFVFRLEKVLTHKTRLFELAQSKHAEVLNILRQEEAKLDALRDTYKTCLNELTEKTSQKFRVRDLGHFYRYLTYIKREIAVQTQAVCKALDEEEKMRALLLEAAKEKEVLEKLKARQHDEYAYAVGREEQNFIDDLNASKYARGLQRRG